MRYILFVSAFAELDLLDATTWYEEQREGLSYEFELGADATFSQIQRNPLGFQIRYDDVRIAFINRFPYGIHYIVEGENIMIVGVYHTSRDPAKWSIRREGFTDDE
ncbi:MAG TPA: hypothetical protein PLD84_12940 [Chitinophagales bacterium]|nr:hypothetical protein [Chitinophagales bacterium]